MSVDDRLRDRFRQRRNEQAFAVIEADRAPMMRRVLTGELVASTRPENHLDPDQDCLWLR